MELFVTLAIVIIQTLDIVLLAYVILSWVLSPYHPLRQGLARLVEPFLAPIRQMMPQTGPFDFSVIVLFIILYIIQSILASLL
jgi:YggT family protein